MSLTSEQRAVVEHDAGNALVEAVAGSGKTTTLVHRVAHLLRRGVPATDILVLQFNRSARVSFTNKLRKHLGDVPLPDVRTYHSYGLMMLRRLQQAGLVPGADIGGEGDYLAFTREAFVEAWRRGRGDGEYPTGDEIAAFRRFITLVKATAEAPEVVFRERAYPNAQLHLIDAYKTFEQLRTGQRASKRTGKRKRLTFYDDMIRTPVLYLMAHPEQWRMLPRWRHVIVDEYQDTNPIQQRLLEGLVDDHTQIMAVGDPKQAIYGFRGADVSLIEQGFEASFAPVARYPLSYSFRFGHEPALLASHVISHKDRSQQLTIAHESCPDTQVRRLVARGLVDSGYGQVLEAHHAAGTLHTTCLLVRTYAGAVPYELELSARGIPYHVYGRPPLIQIPEVAALVAAASLAADLWEVPPEDRARLFASLLHVPEVFLKGEQIAALGAQMAEHHLDGRPVHLPLEQVLPDVSSGIGAALARCIDALQVLQSGAMRRAGATEVLQLYLDITKFDAYLRRDSMDPEEAAEKEQIVAAVMAVAAEQRSLTGFIERMGPVAGLRSAEPPPGDHARLMTIHAAKGLEFPVVAVGQLARDAFPHSLGEPDEERRLAYVAFTRATHELLLLHPADPVLEQHLTDIAAHSAAPAKRSASQFLYDAELGLCGRAAHALVRPPTGEPFRVKARRTDVVEAYFARARRRTELTSTAPPTDVLIQGPGDVKAGDWVKNEAFGIGQVEELVHERIGKVRWADGTTRFIVLDSGHFLRCAPPPKA
jgi:DNA helicase-2/ATP-dependent DNA helicase PcrA